MILPVRFAAHLARFCKKYKKVVAKKKLAVYIPAQVDYGCVAQLARATDS